MGVGVGVEGEYEGVGSDRMWGVNRGDRGGGKDGPALTTVRAETLKPQAAVS